MSYDDSASIDAILTVLTCIVCSAVVAYLVVWAVVLELQDILLKISA